MGTHRCTGGRAASSPSCSAGSWSPPAPSSARRPGSTLQVGGGGEARAEPQRPMHAAASSPGCVGPRPPGAAGHGPHPRPQPSTYQHIPGGSRSGTPHSSRRRTRSRRSRRSPGCTCTGRCPRACRRRHTSRSRCTAAGARRRRLREGALRAGPGAAAPIPGPSPSPTAAPGSPTPITRAPSLARPGQGSGGLTQAVGAVGAGRAAELQRVHAEPLEEVGVQLLPGGTAGPAVTRGAALRVGAPGPLPRGLAGAWGWPGRPRPPPPAKQLGPGRAGSTHSWNHQRSTCSSLCSSSR